MAGDDDSQIEEFEKVAVDICMQYYTGMNRQLQLIEKLHGSSSTRTPKRTIERNREEGHERLVRDYFADLPVYSPVMFRRRFQMKKHVFLRIVDALGEKYKYFQQRYDATGKKGLSPLQKCTSAIRMLAYGVAADALDDYLRIAESTALECLDKFTKGVISLFEDEYLRKPTPSDVNRLLQMGADRGFPGMMGNIDCMHWKWKNCPKAWKGQFLSGHKQGMPTIVLEVVASSDLWIWHAFFGIAGSNNDINVLDRSPIFDDVLEGRAPEVSYTINGTNYNMGYYLTDGIYPRWATFVKSIPQPQGDKRKLFAKCQEAQRKDVERAFGVLQARFAIVRGPAMGWDYNRLGNIMRTCVILHNMIVEDERDAYKGNFPAEDIYEDETDNINMNVGNCIPYEMYRDNLIRLRATAQHEQLQSDLVQHIWEFHGGEN